MMGKDAKPKQLHETTKHVLICLSVLKDLTLTVSILDYLLLFIYSLLWVIYVHLNRNAG